MPETTQTRHHAIIITNAYSLVMAFAYTTDTEIMRLSKSLAIGTYLQWQHFAQRCDLTNIQTS